MTADVLVQRVNSVAVGVPFRLTPAPEPFSFDRVPTTTMAETAYRVECVQSAVRAGFSYSEERLDSLVIWVAVPTQGDPHAAYGQLQVLANSLTSAIVRDGCGAGDFGVPDAGRSDDIRADPTASYQVLRLSLPVTYMVTI